MSDLWACYIVYNCNDYLRASLSTIIYHVDHVILIDGKFNYNKEGSVQSTDGTIETIEWFKEKYPEKVTFIPATEALDEPTKRNIYMDLVPEGDWIWIIDADELAYGQLDRLKPYLEARDSVVVPVWFRHSFLHRPNFIHMRFIRKEEGMRYDKTHYTIFNKYNVNILNFEYWKNVEPVPIWLIHFGEMRNGGKTFSKNDFRENLENVEKPFTDSIFPGKFYCIIPDCDNGADEVKLASRGMSYVLSICRWHKREYLQQPILDVIAKYGNSDRSMKIKYLEGKKDGMETWKICDPL